MHDDERQTSKLYNSYCPTNILQCSSRVYEWWFESFSNCRNLNVFWKFFRCQIVNESAKVLFNPK